MNNKSALSNNTILKELVEKCEKNGFSMFFSVGLGVKQGRCEMKAEIETAVRERISAFGVNSITVPEVLQIISAIKS